MNPSLIITPNAVKAGKLFSIVPTDGSGDLDVVRATSATRVDENGLIEIPRTNLLRYSEEFSNPLWIAIGSPTFTDNAILAPDGTLTADLITKTTEINTTSFLRQSITSQLTYYTLSCYIKQNTGNTTAFRINGNNCNSTFDFSTKTLTNTGVDFISANYEELANGWFKIVVVSNVTSTFLSVDIANMFPNPAGDSVYVWGAQLEQGVTATEYIPTVDSIRTKFAGITQDGGSASNIARLDYSNGSCPSILVEPQRTNLLTYSEQFDNAAWTTNGLNVTVSANSTTAPDGTLLADKVIPLSTTSKYIFQNSQVTSGQSYTYSIFAKKGEYDFLQIVMDSTGFTGSTDWFNVDLTNGTFGNQIINSITDKSITSLTNGWYRITVTKVATSTTSSGRVILSPLNSNYNSRLPSYTSDETSGIILWGVQLEIGSNATSYIPTTTSSVTRNADVISKSGISDLIGQTEGSIYLQGIIPYGYQSAHRSLVLLRTLTTDILSLGLYEQKLNLSWRISDGSLFNSNFSNTQYTEGTPYKACLVYSDNTQKIFFNGVLINTRNINIPYKYDTLDFSGIFSSIISKEIKTTLISKTALSDAEAIQLTTL